MVLRQPNINDFGTPEVYSGKIVNLQIDGMNVYVPEGTSILRASLMVQIEIPKLCATDTLEPIGSCRLCIVEIEGKSGYHTACTTPVEEGMKVRTDSERLRKLRRGIIELYISDHPLECHSCPVDGHCELQKVVGLIGFRGSRYKDGLNHLDLNKDDSNPYFDFDPSLCIVCYRCVKACEEIQGTFALTVENRGFLSLVKPGHTGKFITSECVSCGACVLSCPTGALVEKKIKEKGHGNRVVKTVCSYCAVGCSFYAEVSGDQVVRMVPDKLGKANYGHSCVKGRFAWEYPYSRDRITKPMIRKSAEEQWKECSWDEAIEYVAVKFREIQEKYGRYSIGAVTSARASNEEDFVLQKLVRAVFKNNNVDTCARVCHAPTGYGLKAAFGASAGTNDFYSVLKAQVIMIIGANVTENHPVLGSFIRRRVREGAKLIVIDPRKIDIVSSPHARATLHLRLKPGTNVPLLNSLAYVIVSEGLEDTDFIQRRCDMDTYKIWREFILREENSPEFVEKITGVSANLIREAARIYAKAERASIYYGLGVTEHIQGATAVLAIANLAMITGNIGKEGAGVNPLRGQNNVQGSCDMGSFPYEFSGYRHVSDQGARKTFEDYWGVEIDPEPGFRIPEMFYLALKGKFKGIYLHGYDPVQSFSNTEYVVRALKSMELVVVHDLFMTETAKYSHVFLPACSFLEKEGTFTNSERRVQHLRQVIRPLCGKQEWEVICDIAKAMGYNMGYKNVSEIMDEIAKLTPSFSRINYEKLEKFGGIQWPCNDHAPEGTPIMHKDGFVIGKGKFHITGYVHSPEKTFSLYPLMLTTGRNLYQYNVGTNSRRTPNTLFYGEDLLEIHPDDAKARNIKDGDYVMVKSRKAKIVLRAKITDRVQQGIVFTSFHFPESKTNLITTEYSDWATLCPEYKLTAVQVERIDYPSEVKTKKDEISTCVDGEDLIIQMANNVGRFFEFYPSEDAIEGFVNHIKKFWHPILREELKKFKNSDKLIPLVRKALIYI